MEFRLLGPLELKSGDSSIQIASAKERALLAFLLARSNRFVSADLLVEELWGAQAPRTAKHTLETHVSRLRRMLGTDAHVIESGPGGYRIRVTDDQLDLLRFERLVEEGRAALASGRPVEAEAALAAALALWRGDPLADLTSAPFAAAEAARLEDLLLGAVEARAAASLALGRHAEVVAELGAIVAEHPLREGLRAELMLALYRAGRQAEALESYRDGRRLLVDELGIEPGRELQELQQAILRHDRALDLTTAAEGPAAGVRQRAAPDRTGAAVERPETRYVRSGDVNIAYQVWGDGPFDVVFVPPFVTHVELLWEVRCWAAFNERLGSIGRMITFDKRGTGMSDRVAVQTLEERIDDLRAVMDAAGSKQAAVVGLSEGAALAALFAATQPQRVWALGLLGAVARMGAAPDFPSRHSQEEFQQIIDAGEVAWREQDLSTVAAFLMVTADEQDRKALERMFLLGASPGTARALMLMNMQIDVRGILDSLHLPTLVMWFAEDMDILVEGSRYLAEHIPGARAVELPGPGHFPFPSERATSQIEDFLLDIWSQREATDREAENILTTVLVTDVVGSATGLARPGERAWPKLLERYRAVVRRALIRHRGVEIEAAGTGFLSSFDGPARAIRCANELVADLADVGLEIRAGVHTGECLRLDGHLTGMAVQIGSGIAAEAGAGEVLVSRTVCDLVVGSGLSFGSRGSVRLKGVPGEWELYAFDPRPLASLV